MKKAYVGENNLKLQGSIKLYQENKSKETVVSKLKCIVYLLKALFFNAYLHTISVREKISKHLLASTSMIPATTMDIKQTSS